MSRNNVIGQARAKEILQRAIAAKQVAHAYLFFGPEGIGKDALAIEFAATLVCTQRGIEACGDCGSCKKIRYLRHPNVEFICALPVGKNEKAGDDPIAALTEEQVADVQKKLKAKGEDPYHRISIARATAIKVNSVRQIRRGASLTAVEDGRKIFIISNADEMTLEAANSLLKTLEEPPANTILILTSSHKEQLLPTIISRCQVIQCDLLGEEEISTALHSRKNIDPEQARLAAKLAGGSYMKAIELTSSDILAERQSVVQFLRLALGSNKLELSKYIEDLAKNQDRNSAIRWLMLLQVWLRDAVLLREHLDAGIQNQDLIADLKSFVANFPHADLFGAIDSVERCIALVDKNSYLALVFTTLAFDLHRHSYAESLFSYQ